MARPLAWHFNQAATINVAIQSPWFRVQDAVDTRDSAVANRRPVGSSKLYVRGRMIDAGVDAQLPGTLELQFSEDASAVTVSVTSVIGVVTTYSFVCPLYYGRDFRLQYTPTAKSYAAGTLLITFTFEEDA